MTQSEIGFYGNYTAQDINWRDSKQQDAPITHIERHDFEEIKTSLCRVDSLGCTASRNIKMLNIKF